MKRPTYAVVVTSIGNGDFLSGYCSADTPDDNVKIIVIGDRKSPPALYERCRTLTRRGWDVTCLDIARQEEYLSRFGPLVNQIPCDSDNRRNVGFLMALESGCDVLVSLDDDNYCIDENSFFDECAAVLREEIVSPVVHGSQGWFNVCDLLSCQPDRTVYARGFPYHKRNQQLPWTTGQEKNIVRLNLGLWLEAPDLDSITWLASPVRVRSFRGDSVVLGEDTWTPVNSQNTSLHRDLIVAYYFIPMGYKMKETVLERYGDIFSGYFTRACMDHMQHHVRVGTPVVSHRRNRHQYLRDLEGEFPCILMLEDMIPWLRETRLEGDSYRETYLSLAGALDEQIDRFDGYIWTDAARGYLRRMTGCMRRWADACRQIGV